MGRSLSQLTSADRDFVEARHLATLTTIRSDGSPHVVAIAYTVDFDSGVVTIITSDGSQKVVNVERTGRAAVGQVDGPSWLSFEGPARVVRDAEGVARAVAAYSVRYRTPSENPKRVAIEIVVERVLGTVRA